MRTIEHIWAAISLDPEDQTEGVCAVLVGQNWMPLIAADEERLLWLEQMAEGISTARNMEIKIVEFSHSGVLRTIKPEIKQ